MVVSSVVLKGEVFSETCTKGHLDKTKGGRIMVGRWGLLGWRDWWG